MSGCSDWCRGFNSSRVARDVCCFHESCQNNALSPFLISQKAYFWTSCLLRQGVLWILDPWIWLLNMISIYARVVGAYFCFQISPQSSVGFLSLRHHSWYPITWLSFPGSRCPSLPIALGLQSLSRPTNAHVLSGWCPSHKKLWCMILVVGMTELGWRGL
jgi:hypothetical protein